MHDLRFRRLSKPLSLADVAALGGAELPQGAGPALPISGVAAVVDARRGDLAVATGDDSLEELETTRATACFVSPDRARRLPETTIALVTDDPVEAFERVAVLVDPETRRPGAWPGDGQRHPGALVHAAARIEPGVAIGPGVVVGPDVEIGTGTTIAAACVIEADVRIGRGCSIGPHVTLTHALVGDRVVIHPGARIGVIEPGAARPGRTIVQDGAEIGANAVVARGARRDTVIGEGAQIAAAAVIGTDAVVPRFAVVVARG